MNARLTFSNGDVKTLPIAKVGAYLIASEECNEELNTPITLVKIEAINNCERCGYSGNQTFCPVCVNADIDQMVKHLTNKGVN
jgi:recombinational DNA repair protein RecR